MGYVFESSSQYGKTNSKMALLILIKLLKWMEGDYAHNVALSHAALLKIAHCSIAFSF